MYVPLPVRGPGSTGVVLSSRAQSTSRRHLSTHVRHFLPWFPCSPAAGHAHATAGYAHLAGRAGTRELEGRSSQRTPPPVALAPPSGLDTAVVAPNMARCTCAGSRAHAGPACPESATASTRRAASRRRPTTRRAGRSPRGGGSRCPSLRRPRRRGDEVGRQCGPSCASLPRRKGSTRSAKGEVEDRRRATGDVIDKVQQSKSNQ